MKAIESQDVSAIQQNSNALNEAAKEGLDLLKEAALYKNDKSLVDATKKVFEFFIYETETEITKLTDYLVMNKDFETIQKTLEKTPANKRTKAQVDGYNKKVKEMNNAIKVSNETNAKLNAKRQQALNLLNTANDNFLSRHIPKD